MSRDYMGQDEFRSEVPKRGTVFVVQDHRRYDKDTGQLVAVYDLTPAAQFGDLKFLLTPTAAPWATESIINDLWDGLEDFGDDDYLLMIGNPVLCGLAAAVACDVNRGRIRFLQWNGRMKAYTPVEAQVFEVANAPKRG